MSVLEIFDEKYQLQSTLIVYVLSLQSKLQHKKNSNRNNHDV